MEASGKEASVLGVVDSAFGTTEVSTGKGQAYMSAYMAAV